MTPVLQTTACLLLFHRPHGNIRLHVTIGFLCRLQQKITVKQVIVFLSFATTDHITYITVTYCNIVDHLASSSTADSMRYLFTQKFRSKHGIMLHEIFSVFMCILTVVFFNVFCVFLFFLISCSAPLLCFCLIYGALILT